MGAIGRSSVRPERPLPYDTEPRTRAELVGATATVIQPGDSKLSRAGDLSAGDASPQARTGILRGSLSSVL